MDSKGKMRDAWGRFIKGYHVIQDYDDYTNQITRGIDRKVGRIELTRLLNNTACEIIFERRRPERAPGRPSIRRMICTNSEAIFNHPLNGINGASGNKLNFRRPYSGRPKIDEAKYNLVVVWDIFMQDYRNVSMENCHVRQIIPDNDTFWKYYNAVLVQLSSDEKSDFMDNA